MCLKYKVEVMKFPKDNAVGYLCDRGVEKKLVDSTLLK